MATRFVRPVPNRELVALLEHDPLAHLFPLYLAQQYPFAEAQIVERGGRIRGGLVDGAQSGSPFVQGAWVLAHDPRDARSLFEAYANRTPRPEMDFPVSAVAGFAEVFTGVRVGFDAYYRFDRPRPVPLRDVACRELSVDELDRLELPDDLAEALGDMRTLPERGLFAAVDQDVVVAIADVYVDVGPAVTVQQVNITADRRGEGLGRVLLSHICREIRSRGQDVTYLAAEANRASNRLALSVGFEPLARFGWAAADPPIR